MRCHRIIASLHSTGMKGNLLAIWSREAQLCLKSLQGNIGTAKFPGECRSRGAAGRASSQCLGCSLPPASPAATAASPRDAPRQERGQSPLGRLWEFSEQLRKATVCTANQFGALSGLTTARWGLNSCTSTSLATNSSWGEPQPKESSGEGGEVVLCSTEMVVGSTRSICWLLWIGMWKSCRAAPVPCTH